MAYVILIRNGDPITVFVDHCILVVQSDLVLYASDLKSKILSYDRPIVKGFTAMDFYKMQNDSCNESYSARKRHIERVKKRQDDDDDNDLDDIYDRFDNAFSSGNALKAMCSVCKQIFPVNENDLDPNEKGLQRCQCLFCGGTSVKVKGYYDQTKS